MLRCDHVFDSTASVWVSGFSNFEPGDMVLITTPSDHSNFQRVLNLWINSRILTMILGVPLVAVVMAGYETFQVLQLCLPSFD